MAERPQSDAAEPETPTGTWGDWASDHAMSAAIGPCLALPLRLRLPLMGGLVSRVVAPLSGYQARAIQNLAYVWPDMPDAERRRIAGAWPTMPGAR